MIRRARPAKKVIITGDVLRPAETVFRPAQSSNIRWFSSLVRRSVQRVTGLAAEVVTWGEGFDTVGFYESSGFSMDTAGWAALYAADSLRLDAVSSIARGFQGALVLGFELRVCLKTSLTALDVEWIDFAIHPVRFGPDILFAAQTNSESVLQFLNSASVHPDSFGVWADIMMATSAKTPGLDVKGAQTLLVGQTAADRTLIRDGKLLNFSAFPDSFQDICAEGPVLLKEHPYANSDFGLSELRLPLHGVRRTTTNLYHLLSSSELQKVVALSSSVLVEAPYFFKTAVNLLPLPFDLDFEPGSGSYMHHFSITDNIASDAFWRRALEGLGYSGGRAAEPERLPPNTLRTSLQNFWGYNELNSDLLVRAYAGGPSGSSILASSSARR